MASPARELADSKQLHTHMKPAPRQVEELEQSDDMDFTEALDWRGRPVTDKHGGPRTLFFILVSQGLWNVANFAVLTNLVLYFVRELRVGNAMAANNVTNWYGTTWLLTLVGGFLGDAYWGRFKTGIIFQLVHILGLIILGMSTTIHALKPPACAGPGAICPKPSSLQVTVFFVGLYIIALGLGGYLPVFLAWGADQFDSEEHKTTFFGCLFVFQNIGTILANTLFVYLENKGQWAWAFWLAAGMGSLAFVVFGSGAPTYRQFRPSGNSFLRMAQVMVASARKWHLHVPKDTSQLHELPEKQILRQGSRKLPHTPRFSFLDKAASRIPGEAEGPWRLCNVTQVEELKCLCRMLPIWLCAIPFAAVFAQINTLFVEQAAIMDLRLGSIVIPPASMSVINVLSIIVFTVIYHLVVEPVARMITGRRSGMTQLQRIGFGQVGIALAMAVSAVVEWKRLTLAKGGERMSVFWLSPQYIFLGGSQVFAVVGSMDFFYSEAPHSMRGVVSSLSMVNLAIGSYLSTVVVSITMHVTTRGGRPGWIPAYNLNLGHVDYFYWLLMCLTILDMLAFLIACWWYHRSSDPRPCSSPSPK